MTDNDEKNKEKKAKKQKKQTKKGKALALIAGGKVLQVAGKAMKATAKAM